MVSNKNKISKNTYIYHEKDIKEHIHLRYQRTHTFIKKNPTNLPGHFLQPTYPHLMRAKRFFKIKIPFSVFKLIRAKTKL